MSILPDLILVRDAAARLDDEAFRLLVRERSRHLRGLTHGLLAE